MTQSHEIVVCGVPFETPLEKEALRKLKDVGVTSVQIYTFWKDFEPGGRGQFDWAFYDREVALIQDAGLKYVPFILMGPKYAAPQWWLESPEHMGLRCLEHGKVSPIEIDLESALPPGNFTRAASIRCALLIDECAGIDPAGHLRRLR